MQSYQSLNTGVAAVSLSRTPLKRVRLTTATKTDLTK